MRSALSPTRVPQSLDNKLNVKEYKNMLVANREYGRTERRHSSFYIGLYGHNWVNFPDNCWELVRELLILAPNKNKYYQRGQRGSKKSDTH